MFSRFKKKKVCKTETWIYCECDLKPGNKNTLFIKL